MFGGNKSFFSSTKRGGKLAVTRQVKKIYLRTDIPCGSGGCTACKPYLDDSGKVQLLDPEAHHYLIPDTNVILHNIDAIESPSLKNIIILDTVLGEVKGLNTGVYERLAALIKDVDRQKRIYVFSNENHRDTAVQQESGETMNDRNDKAIRKAAKWYQLHLGEGPEIVLLTHDKANREKAVELGITAKSISEFVNENLAHESDLVDRVATGTAATNERKQFGEKLFPPHLPKKAMQSELAKGTLLKGTLRQGGSNLHEGWVAVATKDATNRTVSNEYLLASRRALNRTIDGDVVAIRVLPPQDWTKPMRLLTKEQRKNARTDRVTSGIADEQGARGAGFFPTAEVVGLLENNRRPVCGSILWDNDQTSVAERESVLCRPVKSNVPYIRMQTRQVEQLKGKRIQVVIDDWSETSMYPEGHVVKVLGDIGDKDVEAEVILLENDIPHYQFSKDVLNCLPKGEWFVEPEEEAVRMDFRNKTVVSVDPPGCKDIDDALHCEKLPNGNYEVGVHIADVTHFVKEESPLDLEAKKRSTSVYLVDRRIDMLPKLLTENLCSLVGNEERYTFSVVWEMTEDCKVVNTKFTKGIIKSKSAMSYYTAQDMVDDPNATSDIAMGLKYLLMLSRVLKAERIKAGALTLASQEMKFTMDMESNNATDVAEYVHIPTMSMIEEWMLFANVAVAEKIFKEFPQWACLRRHPPPLDGAMDGLNEALEAQGMPLLDQSTSKNLADTLDACNDANDPFFNKLVRMLTTRNMCQAKYFSSGEFDKSLFAHYGLAMSIYTHFTSPIRRYSDVIVHRQLAAAIGITKRSTQHMDADFMNDMTANMNYRHTLAQHAGRDSRNLYIGFVFDSFKNGKEIPVQDGYIVRTTESGVVVMVPRFGTEGMCLYDEVTNGVNVQSLKQLDKVKVKLTLRPGAQDDVARNKLLYEILDIVHVTRTPVKIAAMDTQPPPPPAERIISKEEEKETDETVKEDKVEEKKAPKKPVKKIVKKKVAKRVADGAGKPAKRVKKAASPDEEGEDI
eukprot:TRINITY_DN23674_c0_g1_i1.p1 TRINITY_DN23674_c0_g1~~TRINITY_DN23674_c0_g1_i1.p1  ORF type:complete len:1032 (+),score=254.51 TRINITY_DN23674_c0_g1_i1:41-3097(+)